MPEIAICCDLIMKMTVDPSKALTAFVYFFLRSPGARTYLTSQAQGANPTMVKIGKQVVQNLAVPLPPIPRQRAIVGVLRALTAETQRLASIYRQKLAALDELKKSLLHQAFSGEL
jgi:type I restriction enzyme, S subunit